MSERKRRQPAGKLPASPYVSPARSIADLAVAPIAGLAGRRGFAGADIFSHWRAIVGDGLAAVCAPDKITWPKGADDPEANGAGAVLHVRVAGPRAVEVQHRAEEIVAAVNQMFGYRAIARLRVAQGPLPVRDRGAAPDRATTGASPAAAAEESEGDALARALDRLGRAVRGR